MNRVTAFQGVMIAMVVLFVAGLVGACAPAYTPSQSGTCNHGRVWVEPSQDENGEWKAGYCAVPSAGSQAQ